LKEDNTLGGKKLIHSKRRRTLKGRNLDNLMRFKCGNEKVEHQLIKYII